MTAIFTYTKRQRSSAALLMLNATVALLLYFAAHRYLPNLSNDKAALTEVFYILDIVIWLVEAVLVGLAAWFWFENKTIKVCVTSTALCYCDPTFSDIEWQVKIADIAEVKQVTDTRREYSSNYIVLKNGDRKQIMYGNYKNFDRRAFFDALLFANSDIVVPEKTYSYKTQRPAWAKRIRKKFGRYE